MKNFSIEHVDGYMWTPVRTKSRQEKRVAEFCDSLNIKYYLPLRCKLHRYKKRTTKFFLPMFPGYIFCLLNSDIYKKLVICNKIVYKIEIDEKAERQLIEELRAVSQFESISHEKSIIVKPELAKGVKVRIIGGPLQGTEGYITERKGSVIVAVNIELLNQSVSVELDVGDLEVDD